MHLFVYGTLKRGGSRHEYLSQQKFVATVRTRPRYRLYDLGDYPGLVEQADGRTIEGELWDIDADCLSQLDAVEGCDEGRYRRSAIELLPPHDRLAVAAYFYAGTVEGMPDCGARW